MSSLRHSRADGNPLVFDLLVLKMQCKFKMDSRMRGNDGFMCDGDFMRRCSMMKLANL